MGRCPTCSADAPPGQRFCPSCGGALPLVCPSCGATPPPGRFCGSCGAPLPPVGPPEQQAVISHAEVTERRVPTLLFADLVGFTALSEQSDPEDVRELLSQYFQACRTIIGRYGGTVEKFIGDAVMAVWGVPVAHEDDAERAVRVGLELVAAVEGLGLDLGVAHLALRVGVVTGEVAVTVGATSEGMVAGDAVNTAARVQAAAPPGQVWVDEATRSLSSAAVLFEDAGTHALKGKTEPVHLWRARSVAAEIRGGERVDGLEAPLTGRNRELRLLKELFHATEESGRPRLVVVDGEAGVGKTRLSWEFQSYVEGLSVSVAWHRTRCLSYGDGVAFWALAEAIRSRLRLTEADARTDIGDALDTRLAVLVPDADERDWLRPRLAELLGPGSGQVLPREDLFAAWTAFLERVGGNGPVVLVIDDAQYADDGLLGFLEHLLASARSAIFVLALARPELLRRRPGLVGRRTSVIRLDPLDDDAMAILVDGLVEGLPPDARTDLLKRAEGVPLFAVETVRALVDAGAAFRRGGRYVAAPGIDDHLRAIEAPASLHALVAARLDSLTPEERQVVNDASVLGLSFTRDGLEALAPAGVDVDTVLAELRRKEIFVLVVDRFSVDQGQHRFVQNVIRQVAYAGLSHRERKRRHLAVADHLVLEPDPGGDLLVVIAQHLLDAVDSSSPGDADIPELTAKALGLLEAAARRARRLGSPAEALRLLGAVLAHPCGEADRARLSLAAAECAADAGQHQVAIEHAQTATLLYDALGQPVDAGRAGAVHAWSLVREADNAGAIAVAEPRWQALQGAPSAGATLLLLARCLGVAHAMVGHTEAHASYVQQALLLGEALDDPVALAEGLNEMGCHLCVIGAPVAGLALLNASAATARDHDLHEKLAIALINLTSFGMSRTLGAAVEAGREALEASRRSGVRHRIDLSAAALVLALWTAGRLVEARVVLDEALESGVDQLSLIVAHAVDGWLCEATGAPPPPVPPLDAGDSETNRVWLANLLLVRALRCGEVEEAARIAGDSIEHVLAAMGMEDDFMHLWPPLVIAALSASDVVLAACLLEPVNAAPPGIVSPAVAAQFHRLRALVGAARGDDAGEVEGAFRAGVEALERYGAVGLRARAQEEFGRWLIEQQRAGEAGDLFASARRTYEEIGATGWLERLEAPAHRA